jgi:excisionase family DNA binding protein
MANKKLAAKPLRRRLPVDRVEIEDGRLAYGVAEAARLCGVGRSSLFEEIRAGRLKAVKRCGRTLLLREELMVWLRAGYDGFVP